MLNHAPVLASVADVASVICNLSKILKEKLQKRTPNKFINCILTASKIRNYRLNQAQLLASVVDVASMIFNPLFFYKNIKRKLPKNAK
jgi:hypothetical protein